MKLFGLKDENGKEYVIEADLRSCFRNIINVMPIEPTPKFKVGDWVIVSKSGTMCFTHHYGKELKGFNGKYHNFSEPLRIIDIKPIDLQPNAHIGEQNDIPYIFSSSKDFRLATSSEVESHLIKVAEKKGLLKSSILLSSAGYHTKFWFLGRPIKYDKDDDTLSEGGMFLYWKGEWATIIPDKKPLPKTKEELKDLVQSICDACIRNNSYQYIREILDEYED